MIERHLTDPRTGHNRQFPLPELFRESIYSPLAGYEDINDAERVAELLGVIAYNLGNLLRRLVLPVAIQSWSLTPAAAVQDGRTPHQACPVLHLATTRKLLDGDPLSSDSPAHRATRVAPHVIGSPTSGAGAVIRGPNRAPDGTCAARMTSVNVSQQMHELSDRMMRLFSATKAGRKRFIGEIPIYSAAEG